MIQRFFFNWIDLQRGGRCVSQAIKFSAFIDADKAETALPFSDVAVARTEIAVDASVGHGFPPAGFMKRFSFLKNFQILHDGESGGGYNFPSTLYHGIMRATQGFNLLNKTPASRPKIREETPEIDLEVELQPQLQHPRVTIAGDGVVGA
jgi:hypothetical protein